MVNIESPLVSVHWLHQHLNATNIVILDASIPKVTDNNLLEETIQIPHTRFFDIKSKFSDVSAKFPSAVPSAVQFTIEAQKLGVNKDSAVVIYDDKGIYSSARAWYLFKAFGCNNVAVLDGGLPEWKKENFQTEDKVNSKAERGNFESRYNSDYFKFFNDMEVLSTNSKCLILDARSSNRFKGLVPEPRIGLRSGIIPNSKNLPFADLINGNCLKSKESLKAIFNNLAKPDKKLIFSCGSGITACILALGAEIAGFKNLSVYDGSWTEYGSLMKG
jgi:thiosulfate/3-mercaptopyruvate sulfurtransferase